MCLLKCTKPGTLEWMHMCTYTHIHTHTNTHTQTHTCTQELLAIQQNDGPKDIGFFGTRNMGVTHQKLVEILSYAYASAVRSFVWVYM